MVGNDAANEVGVCVTKSDHQLGELLLVKLGHRPEHPFPGHTSELSVCHRLLCHAHNFSWKKTSLSSGFLHKYTDRLNNKGILRCETSGEIKGLTLVS